MMINTIQPLVNLTNANLKAIARFMKAKDIGDLTASTAGRYGEAWRESLLSFTKTDAFNQLARDSFENLSNFTNECMESSFAMMKQGPSLFSAPFDHMKRDAEEVTNSALRAVMRASAAAADAEAEHEAGHEESQGKGKVRQYRQLG